MAGRAGEDDEDAAAPDTDEGREVPGGREGAAEGGWGNRRAAVQAQVRPPTLNLLLYYSSLELSDTKVYSP